MFYWWPESDQTGKGFINYWCVFFFVNSAVKCSHSQNPCQCYFQVKLVKDTILGLITLLCMFIQILVKSLYVSVFFFLIQVWVRLIWYIALQHVFEDFQGMVIEKTSYYCRTCFCHCLSSVAKTFVMTLIDRRLSITFIVLSKVLNVSSKHW